MAAAASYIVTFGSNAEFLRAVDYLQANAVGIKHLYENWNGFCVAMAEPQLHQFKTTFPSAVLELDSQMKAAAEL